MLSISWGGSTPGNDNFMGAVIDYGAWPDRKQAYFGGASSSPFSEYKRRVGDPGLPVPFR